MAYENIEITYSNFCIGYLTDTYVTIDTTNSVSQLQVKNSSGDLQNSIELSTSFDVGFSISSLDYVGPRDVSVVMDGYTFFTLEHNSNSQCKVKRWELDAINSKLDLKQTISYSDTGMYYFNCNSMSVEQYRTVFSHGSTSGTGYILMDEFYASKLNSGDALFLGPSSSPYYINSSESVEVSSVSGTKVYITAQDTVPPLNQYNAGDSICFYKDIFLLGDTGINGNVDKGILYKIDSKTGVIKDYHESGLYSNVKASSYGIPYSDSIGVIKNSNLVFIDKNDYEVKKSFALMATKSDKHSVITIYDISFTNTSVYRLQKEIVLRDNSVNYRDYSWVNYNYVQDGVVPYVDSISMWSTPSCTLGNQTSTTIHALVRDQYGSEVSNKIVYFDRVGDTSGSFDDPNKQAITNNEGIASIGYTSGWYNPNIADSCCDVINFTAHTDGSNIFTGSQYVWGTVGVVLLKKYISNVPKKIIQKVGNVTSSIFLNQLEHAVSVLSVTALSKFWFPGGGGDAPKNLVNIVKQINDVKSYLQVTDIDNDFTGFIPVNQLENRNDYISLSQTYISRHTLSGNSDNAVVNQFKFLLGAMPDLWSLQNRVDTTIWLKVAPFGFSLDSTKVSFKVREVSYDGDTGYIEYNNTNLLQIVPFDAGSGLFGLEITYTPEKIFHYSAVVYIVVRVEDKATPPNIVSLDYWFKVVADYKAPYISNELPTRDQTNVPTNTSISFDVVDAGAGVNISTLELYINNLSVPFSYSAINNGYHIVYSPTEYFFYNQEIDVTIVAIDLSINTNILFDTYRFYCAKSLGPWIDSTSLVPKSCDRGVDRYLNNIALNIYEVEGTGLDKNSIRLFVNGVDCPINLSPVLYRIM